MAGFGYQRKKGSVGTQNCPFPDEIPQTKEEFPAT
jgi:hypothetical protein